MSSTEIIDLLKALLAAGATLGVAAIGLYGVVLSSRKPSRDKPPVGDTGKALENFNGTQNEFMALVIADNRNMRTDIAELRQTQSEYKAHQEHFLEAVRRYLMKLATAWGVTPGPMPWPDDNDFHILEDTLPTRPGAGNIERKES